MDYITNHTFYYVITNGVQFASNLPSIVHNLILTPKWRKKKYEK